MRALALLALLATAASAQPVLAPDSAGALAGRAARAGLLSDSTAAHLASCAEAGVPVTRSALVDAVARDQGAGPLPFEIVAYDTLAARAPPPRWVERLASAGLLTPTDAQALGPLVDLALAEFPNGVPASYVSAQALRLVAALARARATLDPDWLAADARLWVDGGLMNEASRSRLLRDARAGRLWTPYNALAYLDVVEVIQTGYERYGGGDLALDSVRVLVDAGARLLRRRGVADLQVEGLALDSVQQADPAEPHPDGLELSPKYVLSARVDGVAYRQEVGYRGTGLTLLNRVLRDRRSPYRLGTAPMPDRERQRSATAVLVLTPAQRGLLSPSRLGDVSPPRQRVIRAAGEAGGDTPCRDLAFAAFQAAQLEIDVRGPTATGREGALTHEGLTRVLDRLGAVGLLDSLSLDERAAVREGLFEQYLDNVHEIWYVIPGLAVSFHGDDGTYGGGQPYADAIRQFERVSRGAFRPTDVTDTFSFEADSAHVGFTSGAVRYETTVETGSWLHASFVGLIAQAVAHQDVRLYRLGRYTEEGFAFLSREQFATLAQLDLLADGAGLVDPADYP